MEKPAGSRVVSNRDPGRRSYADVLKRIDRDRRRRVRVADVLVLILFTLILVAILLVAGAMAKGLWR